MGAKVGFVGLGRMGLPMVRNLAAAGHTVNVFDTDATALGNAEQFDGVGAVSSPAAVADSSAVVFTCLPNNTIVESVYLGAGGICESLREGLITCDCSTVAYTVSETLHARITAGGAMHMDTPMLGSQPQAESGEIFFIVSGSADHYSPIQPFLDVMGKQSMFVGSTGTANKIKLIHNALGAVNAVAVAEAMALCVGNDVDLGTFYDVVRNGGGMAFSTYFDRRVTRIIKGDYSPTFTVDLMRKDITLAMELAGKSSRDVAVMDAAKSAYDEAVAAGWGDEDFSGVSHVIEKRLGLSLSN